MDALAPGDNVGAAGKTTVFAAPGARYRVGQQTWSADEPGFADAIAQAWRRQWRVKCLCSQTPGPSANANAPAMYLARFGEGYIVKRMPGTGQQHDPGCFSYESPQPARMDGAAVGPAHAAVVRDDRTGLSALRLAFAFSHQGPRNGGRKSYESREDGTVSSRPDRLSLEGLLRLLWQEAELNRWHPSFEGKRHWGLVRHLLLLAANGFLVNGRPLAERLYIPEPFTVERRVEIAQRRAAYWQRLASTAGLSRPRPLGLLIGEIKAIEPMRFGARLTVKHMPDHCLVMNSGMWERMEARHRKLLVAWSTQPWQRLVMAGTVALLATGTPEIEAICVMTTERNWVRTA